MESNAKKYVCLFQGERGQVLNESVQNYKENGKKNFKWLLCRFLLSISLLWATQGFTAAVSVKAKVEGKCVSFVYKTLSDNISNKRAHFSSFSWGIWALCSCFFLYTSYLIFKISRGFQRLWYLSWLKQCGFIFTKKIFMFNCYILI